MDEFKWLYMNFILSLKIVKKITVISLIFQTFQAALLMETNAVEMTEGALILMLTCMDDDGDDIPPASPVEKLIEQLPKGVSLVNFVVDTDKFREMD